MCYSLTLAHLLVDVYYAILRYMSAKTQKGIIHTPKEILLEEHELATGIFLANLGKDITFLIPSRLQGTKTPDIYMDNLLWEIKSPKSRNLRSLERAIRTARKQSSNIIIDLRRMDVPDIRLLSKIKSEIDRSSHPIAHCLAITRSGNLIEFPL